MSTFESDDANPSAVRTLLILLVAVILVGLGLFAYVHFGTPPPASSGKVLSLAVYPIHRELHTDGGTTGVSGEDDNYDLLIVLANVEIQNLSKVPIKLQDMNADLTLPSGQEIIESNAAGEEDFAKVFVAYRELDAQKGQPLLRQTILPPGQKLQGQLIFHYPISRKQWDARSSLAITIELVHQPNLVLQLNGTQTASI
jgi:hypothetical protein